MSVVMVGAACEVCGRWRVRAKEGHTPPATDECVHCGADHKLLRDQRSQWSAKHWHGAWERPGQLIEAVRASRAHTENPSL